MNLVFLLFSLLHTCLPVLLGLFSMYLHSCKLNSFHVTEAPTTALMHPYMLLHKNSQLNSHLLPDG